MKPAHTNFVIDAVAFAAFLALMSTGLLLNYQLPPGSGGLNGMGRGRGAGDREITMLWGWTRHEWGQIHYWIAGILIAVLAVHLVLHWNWIVCVVRGKRSEASGIRFGLGLASVVALLTLVVTPLLVPTTTTTRNEFQEQRRGIQPNDTPDASIDLRGSMTLGEAAGEAGLTPEQLIERLQLPNDVSPNQQLGPLLRRHGMQMSDLRQALNAEPSDERMIEPPRYRGR
jgi:hypothetical protein